MDGHVLGKAELIGTYEKAPKSFVGSMFKRR
jgi:hypothetical protein